MPAVSRDRLAGRKTLKTKDFFNEMEKDQIKSGIDIVSLFSYFGTSLTKKGKSHIGLCPFHDDKNPSLSVDQEKGLYNCFGCGESGDVFDLVGRVKGFSFTESLAFLKEYSGNGNNKTHRAVEEYTNRKTEAQSLPVKSALAVTADLKKKDSTVEEASKNEKPAGKVNKTDLSGITLDIVSEHYKKSLLKHPAANSYLKGRGFTDYSLYERLGIGFADGSLLSMVSDKQKEELKTSGIINKKGSEHFAGCITVPFFDEAGRVVSFYGRAIDNKRKVKHLYSPGSHKGLVNRKAAGVYREEIILTESVLDSLSLIQAGCENVIPCYGVNGFTNELLKLLKDERVKTVVIAFDADKAGRDGSEKLCDKLNLEGFSVKIIEPPSGKDWNEGLTNGLKKEEITTILHQTKTLKIDPDTTEDFTAKKEGQKYLFTIAGVSYRLLGVKEMFVSSLRVNIRAEKEEAKYLDNVDLYSARSRSLFSSQLSHVLNLETVRIEKDLIRIVEYLETERDKKLLTTEEAIPELTEEEKRLGMEFLCDPDIFERIVSDTEVLGYVGESVNKQLIYLAASSRKLTDPISVIVVSQSSAGKSYLIDTVKKLIPPEEVVSMTSLSDQALNYLDENALLHKFLVMGEAVHSEAVEHQVREMLSAHELSRLVTMKDPKTGELRSRMVKKEVIVSAVMSTTNHNINPENASRSFVVNTDESEEQTRAIHVSQRLKYSVEGFKRKQNLVPEIIKTHFAAQRLLTTRTIVNPFAHVLDFPSSLMRSRRDHERFIDLISAVCFLRQFQKEVKTEEETGGQGETQYIECDLEDYKLAYRIMTHILPSTLTSFPKSAHQLYEAVRGIIRKKAKEDELLPSEVSVTQREIREASEFNQRFIKRYLKILVDYEYLKSGGIGVRGSRNSYRLYADEDIRLVDLSMIPTPEEMELKLKNLHSGPSGP